MIISGEASGNQALRTEHLAERFGVSATPVREALMSLTGEGLVQLRPGRGFRVVPMSRQDLLDIYDAQAYFAGELAGRAASRLTDGDLAQIDLMQERIIDGDQPRRPAAEQIQWDLHSLINRVAQADKLRWLLRLTMRSAPFTAWSSVTGLGAGRAGGPPAVAAGIAEPQRAHVPRRHDQPHVRNMGDLLANHLSGRASSATAGSTRS